MGLVKWTCCRPKRLNEKLTNCKSEQRSSIIFRTIVIQIEDEEEDNDACHSFLVALPYLKIKVLVIGTFIFLGIKFIYDLI